MGVLQYVINIFNRVVAIYGLALQILTALVSSGWYIVVRDAANVTDDIHTLLEDPTCGQTAQCNKLDTILTDLATLTSDIAALGSPQQTGAPVTLPTTPPSAYIAPTSSANASSVWSTVSADAGTQMGQIMAIQSAFWRVARDSLAFPGRFGQGFEYSFDPIAFINSGVTGFPEFNTNTILPTHTSRLDWLNDQYPSSTWNTLGDGSIWTGFASGNGLAFCLLTEGDFELERMLAGGPEAPGFAKGQALWPGLANVTLGSPHTMVPPGETVSTPCDGVIVAITGVPSWTGSFQFGTATAWRNVGAVSFFDDNGEQEFAQTLAFADAVYVPQAMQTAAGYSYRAAIGVSGTLTPYTIN